MLGIMVRIDPKEKWMQEGYLYIIDIISDKQQQFMECGFDEISAATFGQLYLACYCLKP